MNVQKNSLYRSRVSLQQCLLFFIAANFFVSRVQSATVNQSPAAIPATSNINSLTTHFAPLSTSKKLFSLDEPFAIFKTTGKLPMLIKVHPGKAEISTVLCGTYDVKKEKVGAIKDKSDLQTLIALREIVSYIDINRIKDTKFVGWRQNGGLRTLENIMQNVGVLERKVSSRKILFDEWQKNISMKWVLNNPDELSELQHYFAKRISQTLSANTKNSTPKPLLVIQFADGSNTNDISDANKKFLNRYFFVVSRDNSDIKKFFEDGQSWLFNAAGQLNKPKKVGQSFGEMIIDSIESGVTEFKVKENLVLMLKFLVIAALVQPVKNTIKNMAADPINKFNSEYMENKIKPIMTIAGVALSATAVTLLLYNFMNAANSKAEVTAKIKRSAMVN